MNIVSILKYDNSKLEMLKSVGSAWIRVGLG